LAGICTVGERGSGLLALTSMMNSAFAFGDDTALIMGGTGIGQPNPRPGWVTDANELYVVPHFLITPRKA
jgi:hypothetical protein